ncbi:MAG: magnesium/cobalt transporter CorA [Candidatus Melainabacteria bacterium]|nr:magnesium/cobalt transporter CorA [Candidatus Melainabacteria bacterium]
MNEMPRPRRRQERITAEFNMPGRATFASGEHPSNIPLPVVHVMAYGPDGFVEKDVTDLSELIVFFANWPVTWVNVDPVAQGAEARLVIERFAKIFSLHELVVDDIVNVHQRSKVEEYEEHLFVVTRMLIDRDEVETEQLSLFLGKNFVLTFREVPKDCLDPVREKIRRGRGRIRQERADYLMYAIIDAVVDSYFPLLASIASRIDVMEDNVLEKFEEDAPSEMYQIRRDVLSLRRAIWPARELLNTLIRDTVPLISDTTRLYLRDCHDHSIRIIDLLEMYREVCSALMEVHYTRASNRLNEVMKSLTLITTLFIPPTLIAGIYGMNFNSNKSPYNMPELQMYYGYPVAILMMILVTLAVVVFLNYKGWLRTRSGKH